MRDDDSRKLDHDLGVILSEAAWAGDASFPVIVTTHKDALESLVSSLREKGVWIRHVMPAISAVSAYLTLDVIRELVSDGRVLELELAQAIDLAGK